MPGKGNYVGPQEETIVCLKYTIFAFNFLSWLMGAIIFALGLWIRFDEDFQKWVKGLGMQHYWTGIYILMFIGLIVMVVSFFGCCGVITEARWMLKVFVLLLAVCFVFEMAGAAYTLSNGIYHSKIYPWLQNQLTGMVARYSYDKDARWVLDMIQEYVGCCGGNGSGDYQQWHIPTPNTCRDPIQGNEWANSCSQEITFMLQIKTGWIAGITLFLCFFQILMVLFAFCLHSALKSEEKSYAK
ncbi:tetraspanin-2A-like [Amphibalanus amphitrite]|uniref:tetraspanin-2A-like n=1 Tax=Amphibalanus amphitrite TaxID=1232801 RepID=UPI001C927FE3|nr:tetraspanin-2A-like [Amphibalanus amphitrite]